MQAHAQDPPPLPAPATIPAASFSPDLADWLRMVLRGQRLTGTTLLSGGYRNRNTRIDTDAGQAYVLRQYGPGQPPPAPSPPAPSPPAAKTCAVEAALAWLLLNVAPVPELIGADPEGVATGQPVLLFQYVPGVQLGAALAQSGPADQARLGQLTGHALAAIGTVSFEWSGFFVDGTLQPTGEDLSEGLAEFVERCLASGPAASVLSPAELAGLRSLARDCAPLAERAAGACQLVHADFNPKNLLARRVDGQWSITAVLDWEFAFSGSPLHDIGNMLRFSDELPPAFVAGFTEGFRQEGGYLPPGWREVSEALDLFALGDLLTRPPDHPYFIKAVAAIRARLARPSSARPESAM